MRRRGERLRVDGDHHAVDEVRGRRDRRRRRERLEVAGHRVHVGQLVGGSNGARRSIGPPPRVGHVGLGDAPQPEPAVQVGLHGAQRPIGRDRDLRERPLGEEPERDDLAVRLVERRHRGPQLGVALGAQHGVGGVGRVAGRDGLRPPRGLGSRGGGSSHTTCLRWAARRIASRMAIRASHAPNGPSARHDASDRYAITNASWATSSASARSPRTRVQAATTDRLSRSTRRRNASRSPASTASTTRALIERRRRVGGRGPGSLRRMVLRSGIERVPDGAREGAGRRPIS